MKAKLKAQTGADPLVGWIAAAFMVSQLAAIGWDLPGSYGWWLFSIGRGGSHGFRR